MTEEPRIAPDEEGRSVVMVRGGSNTHQVAGSILKAIRADLPNIEVRAVGAGAVNQAVKGCAVATSLGARDDHLAIVYRTVFRDVTIDGAVRSAIAFEVVVQ